MRKFEPWRCVRPTRQDISCLTVSRSSSNVRVPCSQLPPNRTPTLWQPSFSAWNCLQGCQICGVNVKDQHLLLRGVHPLGISAELSQGKHSSVARPRNILWGQKGSKWGVRVAKKVTLSADFDSWQWRATQDIAWLVTPVDLLAPSRAVWTVRRSCFVSCQLLRCYCAQSWQQSWILANL